MPLNDEDVEHSNFKVEDIFRIESFLQGKGIHVSAANLSSPGELEDELRRLKPSDIILIEPFLEAMRVIELHEAERQ